MSLGCAFVALTLVPVIRPGAAQSPRSPGDGCAIRYVANAGILFESHATSFLIDAPIRESIPPYAAPDAAERRTLEGARPPFDRVAAILITHWHDDHLSAPAVGELLKNSPATVLVSSREVVERVREAVPNVAPARLIALTPEPGRSERTTVGGVPVHVLRIRHNPARRFPEQHVGFLVEGCRTVLHGSTSPPFRSGIC
jgi:L-ascorbate metabolism protein UlaG (beta-lactamase superfamily)